MKYTITYIGISGHKYKHAVDVETRNQAQIEAHEIHKTGRRIVSVRKAR